MQAPPVAIRVVSLLAALAYVYYLLWPKWKVPAGAYHVADALMAVALIACMTERKQQIGTRVALCASLAWLVSNYVRGLFPQRSQWVGYDGFALASLIAGQHDFSI